MLVSLLDECGQNVGRQEGRRGTVGYVGKLKVLGEFFS